MRLLNSSAPSFQIHSLTALLSPAIDYIFVFNNSVQFLYDSTTLPFGSSAYIHSKGQNDEMCTGVAGMERYDGPCTLLESPDGWRRVIFPETNECCKFCNTTDYCGIVRPDWLQHGAAYQGKEIIAGMTCDGWMKQGGEQNYWYADAVTQQPCLYYEGYPTLPASSNYWRFIPSGFSRAPIPAAAFSPPAGCDALCKTGAATFRERLEDRHAAGIGGITRLPPQ